MAESTHCDAFFQYLDLLAPATIVLIPGLVIHSFIIGVNVDDWWKGRSVTSIDHIVTSLGFSRMCAQCADTLYLFVLTFFLNRMDAQVAVAILDALHAFWEYTNIWLTTLLSIVFCLKISNFRTRLFLYLRRVILPRTGHFIVASGIISVLNWLLPFWTALTEVRYGGTYNNTVANPIMRGTLINSLYNITIGGAIPLLFYYISSILLFSSLYHHTVKMKMSSNLSINLEIYYSAMKFVSITFIYYTLYFTGHGVCIGYYYIYCISLRWLYIVIHFLPILHSSYLIYRTTKLRNTLWIVMDLLFQKEGKKNRENVEVVS